MFTAYNLFHGNVAKKLGEAYFEVCEMNKEVTRMIYKLEVEGRKLIPRTLAGAIIWTIKKLIVSSSFYD